jgi:leucyl-tRNA synthetase
MAIAPDHPLAQAAAAKNPKLADSSPRQAPRHRAGDHRHAGEARLRHRHPGDPSVRSGWKLPVYVANFILMEYGTGAIFGCPAHDQRDLDFVNKYGSAIRRWCARRTSIRRRSSSPTSPMTATAA